MDLVEVSRRASVSALVLYSSEAVRAATGPNEDNPKTD